uniref:Uncharacterized protein n=1 Tax=Globisporangium ultimum (strain ATCC 200006 / CBS 805.95 / DAOM BR144) TaxID=431595 RepID=K3XB82_GLOUD
PFTPPEVLIAATPPLAVSVATADTVLEIVVSTPMEIHAKIPSSTESPRRTYSMIGSNPDAADSEKMLSAELSVMAWVFTAYLDVASTSVIRSWSKKIWPT